MASIERAKSALQTVQDLDSKRIVRREELGTAMNFADIEMATRATIDLFRQISSNGLDSLPINLLERVQRLGESFQQRFQQILSFRPESSSNPKNERDALANQLTNEYPEYHAALSPVISYLQSLEGGDQQVRSALQEAKDRIAATEREASEMLKAASDALEEAKKFSAERGVSQQAYYFQKESEIHDREAKVWKTYIRWLAAAAIFLLGLALSLYKWSWLTPSDAYQAVQLSLSKALIFSTIAYLLILSARNFLAHQHNAVINRHRQNALQTFEALVNAAGPEKRDIVLTHAAACIFSPQETGYTKASPQTNVTGLIETIPRVMHSGQ